MMRKSPLPDDMLTLLEVAAGDGDLISEVSRATGRSEGQLQHAASFFVEQILLADSADFHRVLGGDSDTPIDLLRRHMALMMRWSHPDVVQAGSSVDRSVFAGHVTGAWNALKTQARCSHDMPAGAATAQGKRESAGHRSGERRAQQSVRRVRAQKGERLFVPSRRQSHGTRAGVFSGIKKRKRRLPLFRIDGDSVVTWLLRLWRRV